MDSVDNAIVLGNEFRWWAEEELFKGYSNSKDVPSHVDFGYQIPPGQSDKLGFQNVHVIGRLQRADKTGEYIVTIWNHDTAKHLTEVARAQLTGVGYGVTPQ